MKLSCTIRDTEFVSRANYFVVVQVQNSLHTSKFRTEIVTNATSPRFYKNIFRFKDLVSSQGVSVKLGVFSTSLTYQPEDQTQVLEHSTYLGVSSVKLSPPQLYSLKQKQLESYTKRVMNGQRSIGTITFEIRVSHLETEVQNSIENKQLQEIEFNPYQTNQYLINSNISKLEELVECRLAEYEGLRGKWQSITNTDKKVRLTEIKLKDHVEKIENYNLELNLKLNNQIDEEVMLASFELLKDTSKGQSILTQKVDYLRERLNMEKEEHAELAKRFKIIEPQMNAQIEKIERYNQLTRDVKDQEFQIERNNQLLKIYDDRMEKLRANQYAIKSLRQGLKRTDFTAKQALILLQDAKYKAKLKEYTTKQQAKPNYQKSIDILQMIEGAAKVIDKQEDEFQFAEPFEFKLQALRDQIGSIETKIRENRNR